MLRRSFSFLKRGAVLCLLAVFMVAGASEVQAESGGAGQLQCWVTIDGDAANVRFQQNDLEEGLAAVFARSATSGRWQLSEQAASGSSGRPASRVLGYAVAMDGDYAIVGAQWEDNFAGAAYIFKRKGDGWAEPQRLSPDDLGRFDHFGSSVSISGDYAIVGATWQNLFRGAVYVFKREGKEWVLQDKLTAGDAKPDDQFGYRVRIDGSDITVAAGSADVQDAGEGFAYQFRLIGDAWAEQQKVKLSALEMSSGQRDQDLIESVMDSDLLALTETIGTYAGGSASFWQPWQHFVRGDIDQDGYFTGNSWDDLMRWSQGPPFPCDDAADVNDDGVLDDLDSVFLWHVWTYGLFDSIPQPYPEPGPDSTWDALGCGVPPFIVAATDGAFEDRVEIVWPSFDLDAIVYRVLRDSVLLSVASSEDSIYADTTGVRGRTYEYCVVITDMAGNETPPMCDSGSRIVFPPEDVRASDGEFDDFVLVTWTDMSLVEAGYLVRRDSADICTTGVDAVVFKDSSADTGTAYDYEVIAFDGAGSRSEAAADRGFRGIILPPLDVSASYGEYCDFVRITWKDQAENEAGYNIYRDGLLIESTEAGTDTMFFDDFSPDSGWCHLYCVTTRDSSSKESIPVCDQGGIYILPPPQYVAATDSTFDDRVEITWDDPSDLEDGFEILRDGAVIDTTGANITFYKDVNPVPGSWHVYCVIAYNDSGGRSAEVCDSGFQSIVLAPVEVEASDGDREDRVDITWESTSTTAVLFRIFRDTTFIKSVNRATLSYRDYGGTAGQKYAYSVRAVTALEDEAQSEPDSGSRELRAPTQFTATDEEYEDRIVLSWADNSRLEQGYLVTRADTTWGGYVEEFWLSPNRTSYTDYDTKSGLTYTYSVAAWDSLGEELGFSAPAADSGGRVLLAPSNVQATDGKFERRIEITWEDNSNAEFGYKIWKSGELYGQTDDNCSYFVDTNPGCGEVSEYSVAAYDLPYEGQSSAGSDTGSTAVFAPGSFNASDVYGDRIELTWVDLSEVEEGYVISRNESVIASVGPDTTFYTDSTAADGVTYQYCVRAFCSNDSSVQLCDYGLRVLPADLTKTTELDVKLLASDGAANDFLGSSVAVSGDVAILGAWGDDLDGGAYIFTRGSDGQWTETQKLVATDSSDGDMFGWSVGISGNVAIVGAVGDDDGRGSAYIFTRSGGTWTQTQKLTASDGVTGDHFGRSVAISGDVAIVGAENALEDLGAAYIFRRAGGTWNEEQRIEASPGSASDLFGYEVAIQGDVAVVGASWDDEGGGDAGAAYVFARGADGTWTQTEKLRASDGESNDWLGGSVAISGDLAIIGATGDGDWGENSGSAYIFARSADGTWTEKQKLLANDGAGYDCFGSSVAIDGNVVIVGADNDDDLGSSSGSAYTFSPDATDIWRQTSKLLAADGAALDDFGQSVAIDAGTAIIGAQWNDDDGDASGSAYAYEYMVSPGGVTASNGTLNSRVRIRWEDRSSREDGFRVYRGEQHIATVAPDMEVYEDLDAQPGRTYGYGVEAFSEVWGRSQRAYDFGWRPPNGNITGRVSTPSGAGVKAISVGLDPEPIQSLLPDGTGGHVDIPDEDGTFNFGPNDSYTVEAWVKYSGEGGSGSAGGVIVTKGGDDRFPFMLWIRRHADKPGQVCFSRDDGDLFQAQSDCDTLNDGTWHHIAGVHDGVARQLRIYVDGTFQGYGTSGSAGASLSNDSDVQFGVAPIAGSWFGGQIDEVRMWNVARSSSEINATMSKRLAGDEEGLVGYWPLDRDGTGVITDLGPGAHYGLFQGGVYWADNAAPMDVSASTDVEGNYAMAGIRYGQETTFNVTPFEGQRQFQPAFKAITLSTEHPVENQVNFIETSSFTVSGVVDFAVEDADCPAPNVEILVDNQLGGLTDKNGKYAVAVGNGDHWVRPRLEGRTFDPESLLVHVEGDTEGIDFSDTTKRTLSGRVGGGCGYDIGVVSIRCQSENSCMEIWQTEDTEYCTSYSVQLPPQKYLVSASVDWVPEGLNKGEVMEFFENLGDRVVDLTQADTTLDFVYRAPLEVTIRGLEDYITDCDPLTFRGKNLPDSLPVIPQLTVLDLEIEVYEDYGIDPAAGEPMLCALDSGTVIIYDEIFDQQNDPKELVVKNGVAKYKTFASTPSLIAGRLDSQGNDRSFQKALQAVVVVEGRTPAATTEWVLVTGHVAPQGADFVTATATELPLYILRDPPGDQSYAYIEEGYQFRSTIDYGNEMTGSTRGVKTKVSYGVDEWWFVGLGAGRIFHAASEDFLEVQRMEGSVRNEEWKTEITLTTKEKFSTSSDDLLVGEGGDVFVGTGFNFIFSEVALIDIQDCEVIKSTQIGFQPDSIATTFAYAHQYIQDVLIPELSSMVAYYQAKNYPDSAALFRVKLENWQDVLATNDSLKREAAFKENRSFSAGADFEFFFESDTTKSYTKAKTHTVDWGGELSGLDFEVLGFEFQFSIPWSVHNERVEDYTDTSGTRSRTIGYVLSDDDLGDHYTVDIKEDGVYPSPVFDVLAGVSSCPYEAWPDEADSARMVPRDGPVLATDGTYRIDNVPPDEPATFTLFLNNQSLTFETREYVLQELTTSNPGGAIIKANGAPLSQGVSYVIDAETTNEVTLTVERGPTKYHYPGLELILYSPCDPDICSTLGLDVYFKAPCSDITLAEPDPGWTFNIDQLGGPLKLAFKDYTLDIGGAATVEKIVAQRRRLGTGLQGPGEWKFIGQAIGEDIGESWTYIDWHIPETLEDGVYELRGYTDCGGEAGNKVYSNVSAGTIDLTAPQVLGLPEPSDGELSLGEDISITFNEPIDCASINADSMLTYLEGPDSGQIITVDWVCDGRTIVIAPAESVDPNDLEGWLIEAHVEGVCDLVGNPMDTSKTWTFTVRQSVFTWNRTAITKDIAFLASGSMTADLVNGSDTTAIFSIPFMPPWIDSVSPDAGSIAPGGSQSISFAIRDSLTIGEYKGVLAAQSNRGKAILAAYLTVSCHEPVWEMDPGRYEHTMTIVAEVDINGTMSSNPNDRVAAFVGNQLRGVADVTPAAEKYLVFLTVASNRTWGENVRFQVWDDTTCKLYNSTLERFPFVKDDRIGNPDDPVTLTAKDVPPDTWQVIPLVEGWTWFSTNVQAVDMSPNGVLADLTPAEGDIIKSDSLFNTFDPDMGWVGTLPLLDNVHSYMIRLSEQGNILQEGSVVDPDTTPIPVDDGWNWVGYLPTGPMAVGAALGGLTDVSDGDMVKSQTVFAQRLATEWYGSLDSMEAGLGYKLYLQSAPASGNFYYPGSKAMAPTWAGNPEQKTNRTVETTETVPGWSVNRHTYQYNMTVVAALNLEGEQCRDEDHLIAALVDGECRGIGRPMYLSTINRSVAFLMIHSNSVAGERVEFQAFIPEERAVYNVAEAISYEADGTVGTIREPLLLSTEGIAFEVMENLPTAFSLSQNYPNPFNPITTIEYSLPEQSQVKLEVFNVLGQKVKTLADIVQPAGRHRIVWDGKDDQGKDVASGIYFYRLEAGQFTDSKRMVILK